MNNFEYMVVTMDGGKDHHIKLAGTTEEPYFCGKDVCETLGYENIKATLFKLVEPENKKELNYLGPNDPQKVVSNLDTTFLGINRPLTFNEGKAIYINEDGLRSLISGSRTHKNKTLFLNQVDKWLLDTRSGLVDFFSFIKGYNLAFDLESGWFQDLWYPLTKKQFLNSNHEKDTRYGANFGPKPNHSQPSHMAGLTMVRNRPSIASQSSSKPIHEKDTRYGANFGPKPNHFGPSHLAGPEVIRNHPFIITQNIIEWMGFEGRDISDKQERFARMLKRNTIPYYEIDCNHPFALEYSCVQREIQTIPKNNLDKKRWICMDPKDFKKTVLRLNTKTADMVRDFYLNLEEAVVAYSEYTLSYMVEKATLENRVAKSQLALKEKSEEELSAQLALKEKSEEELSAQLATKDEETKELNIRLEEQRLLKEQIEIDAKEKLQRALKFNQATKQVEPQEYIYIATTDEYSLENKFKPGGCASFDLVKSRLSQYNSGKSDSNSHYFIYLRKVPNYRSIEQALSGCLGGFRENANKELYIINFDWLVKCLDAIIDHNLEFLKFVNCNRMRMVEDTINLKPTVITPLRLEKIRISYQRIGEEEVELTTIFNQDVVDAIKDSLLSFNPDNNIIKRVVFEDHLRQNYPKVRINNKKRPLWEIVKQIGVSINPKWRYKY